MLKLCVRCPHHASTTEPEAERFGKQRKVITTILIYVVCNGVFKLCQASQHKESLVYTVPLMLFVCERLQDTILVKVSNIHFVIMCLKFSELAECLK